MSIQQAIESKIRAAYPIHHLEVINESHKHRTAPGAESHFRVVLVSPAFAQVASIARHRSVNQTLAEELGQGVHALALQLYTPEQWQQSGEIAVESPPCAHKK